MAPTKPLVEQQIRACHDVMGIPPSDTGALVMLFSQCNVSHGARANASGIHC
jgi:ERCC4-related helicase